jgi:hypothetical protein
MSRTATRRAAPSAEFIDIGAIDRTLAEHGSFTVLDWLVAEGRLAYSDYASWREGRRATLDEALALKPAELDRLLAEVDRHGDALRLAAESREVYAWSASHADPLAASARAEVHRRLVQQWRRATVTPQFDLFMDNAAAAAERRLCEQLAARRFDDAARELDTLSRLDPANRSLGGYQDLILYGRHQQTAAPADAAGLRAELEGLEKEVQPLAKTLLAAGARDYLALAWKRLAQGLLQLPSPEKTDDRLHPSYAFAQIPDWAAVRQCLQSEPDLLAQPQWLQRLARACRATGQPELGVLWWLVCLDRHPQRAITALEHCDDPVLADLWNDFLQLEDRLQAEPPPSGFPGFVLLRRPGLIHHLGAVAPLQQAETVAILRLIEARRAGADEIALRRSLSAIAPVLLEMYLAVCGR